MVNEVLGSGMLQMVGSKWVFKWMDLAMGC